MAGDWIKIETVTPDKPEVGRLAERLNLDPDAVVGKLVRLWIWADQQSLDGHALSVTFSHLDRVTFCPGFASELQSVGWLVCHADGVTFPNFERHNGQTAKNRALANRRKAKQRAGVTDESRECHAESVTKMGQQQGPEKRREEIDKEGGTARAREVGDDRIIHGHYRPTLEQAIAGGAGMMISEDEARDWWDRRESSNWLKAIAGGVNTTAVGPNWQSDMRQFVNGERNRRAQDAAAGIPSLNSAPPPNGEPDSWGNRPGAKVAKFSTATKEN